MLAFEPPPRVVLPRRLLLPCAKSLMLPTCAGVAADVRQQRRPGDAHLGIRLPDPGDRRGDVEIMRTRLLRSDVFSSGERKPCHQSADGQAAAAVSGVAR